MSSDLNITPDLARLLANNGTSLEEFEERCRKADENPKVIALMERWARLESGNLTDEDRAFFDEAEQKEEKRKAEAKAAGALWIIDDSSCYADEPDSLAHLDKKFSKE
ncbi:hypothetical protein JIN84_05960 [Luteolibacter yonseiensis]|uniref:Uncharacterized protein n=1 Tax=Luteolibacter yonseiensis TaxID=1144680 RepID=A0A934R2A9_9BACT|nr:hypothetical protein [Luteolibacter yonseiensis]MBK1815147.1 hypothetical protein [Luteolibacter yonseiensis]